MRRLHCHCEALAKAIHDSVFFDCFVPHNDKFVMRLLLPLIICCLFLQGSTFVIDGSYNAAMHNNNGVVFLHDGNYLAAISEFKIAILLMPEKPVSACYYNNLGLSYNLINHPEWAQASFEKALSINPNFFEYYKNLVKTYKYRNTLQKNLANYKSNIKNNNNHSISWLFIGLIYEETGMKKDAVNAFVKYTKLEPSMILTDAVNKHLDEIKK
ncbi:MAG: tetratricopeptide repeat protein [Candidatus Gastranaerophilaceae bacterium]|jgi:tetratricopeptide (TPR) repeat protein